MTLQEGETAPMSEPMLAMLGYGRVIEYNVDTHRAIVEFKPSPEHCHSGGIVQGGFVTGWIDTAMARAAILSANGSKTMTTLEVKISFLKAAQAGKTYRAEGWVVRSGKSVMFMEGQLTDAEGTLIAKGTATGQWLDLK